jgi:3-phosphoglycerate kinase
MNKKTLQEIDVRGKKVLVRVDFNVPLHNGEVLDETRIVAALTTIKYLVEQNARVILVTHLGRPKGKVVPDLSVRPLVNNISRLLNQRIMFAGDCGGPDSARIAGEMKGGEVVLLENVRFDPGEEENDPELGHKLAKLAEVFVNEAFGDSHRAHASTVVVTRYLPAVAGFLMEKEIRSLSEVVENPTRPFVIVLGGAKVKDKIPVVENLIDKVDSILIGGVMANTFLKSQNYDLGKTLAENESLDMARDIMKKCTAPTGRIINSWISTLLSACFPPLRMFIIGTGNSRAFTPPT